MFEVWGKSLGDWLERSIEDNTLYTLGIRKKSKLGFRLRVHSYVGSWGREREREIRDNSSLPAVQYDVVNRAQPTRYICF